MKLHQDSSGLASFLDKVHCDKKKGERMVCDYVFLLFCLYFMFDTRASMFTRLTGNNDNNIGFAMLFFIRIIEERGPRGERTVLRRLRRIVPSYVFLTLFFRFPNGLFLENLETETIGT